MKQDIDTFTLELPGLGNPLTNHREAFQELHNDMNAISDKFKYRFYIRTNDGATTEWTGLTRKRARDMHAYTEQSQPSNVTAFGWELTQ
jgi:predicted mannosyl-3-phosphoglycerate phosphatase (HAD superfamily)